MTPTVIRIDGDPTGVRTTIEWTPPEGIPFGCVEFTPYGFHTCDAPVRIRATIQPRRDSHGT